jgi:hypothetical protein
MNTDLDTDRHKNGLDTDAGRGHGYQDFFKW